MEWTVRLPQRRLAAGAWEVAQVSNRLGRWLSEKREAGEGDIWLRRAGGGSVGVLVNEALEQGQEDDLQVPPE